MSVVEVTTPGLLRQRWREGSTRSAWAFPSDWYTPAVDALCEAICVADAQTGPADADRASRSSGAEVDAAAAAWRLGRERARAAVCLAETLRDLDVLAGLAPVDPSLLRSAALGWADGCAGAPDGVVDGLTGLVSPTYLTVRVGEVYRAADVEGSSASASHALVIARLPGDCSPPWARDLPMILVADAMRSVFSGGQTLARLGPSVAAALVRRGAMLGRRVRVLGEMLAGTMCSTGQPGLIPQLWIEQLPPAESVLPRLLRDLAR